MQKPEPFPRTPSLGEAIALIVIGLLAFVPSGLCTGIVIMSGGWQMALLVGGPFVLGGAVLIGTGLRNLYRYLHS